ncbi:hypothetical protein [Roseobacter cerasinus]|uniref:hypothetical protein n=1 Tax=Roseobacter cerasinus TaxID=2602289 RepID=UPI0013576AC1|nr:hypothetical protein [Roseobacter cerasinus]
MKSIDSKLPNKFAWLDALNKFTRRSLILLVLFLLSLPPSAEADRANHCPEVWSQYVDTVEDILTHSSVKAGPVFFVGTGGEVYDCLDENVGVQLFEEIGQYHKAISHLFEGNLTGGSSEWPDNVCSVGDVKSSIGSYIVINLPHVPDILSDEICLMRIVNSLDRRINH